MTVYHIALEPLDQRYTAQWLTAIPHEIHRRRPNLTVRTITGRDGGTSTTPGAFLDFAMTNVWKNDQLNTLAQMFSAGAIHAGDVFLFTDAWNSGIIQLRYMSALLGIPITIHGIWHAGAYDPTDILGFTITDKAWVHTFERAIYHALDANWYGSHYHKTLFCTNLQVDGRKAFHSGQPHRQILATAQVIPAAHKDNLILFGHRLSPDKQPNIFEDLAKQLPQYEFVCSQHRHLDKPAYYDLIRRAKISFSANLHENFGISMVEAVFNGTVPLMPTRLSYTEMYSPDFLYPSVWTQDWASYLQHRSQLVALIEQMMTHYDQYHGALAQNQAYLLDTYMTSTKMIDAL